MKGFKKIFSRKETKYLHRPSKKIVFLFNRIKELRGVSYNYAERCGGGES